jgi:hypothetical protein
MRCTLVYLLLGSLAYGQAANPAPPTSNPSASTQAEPKAAAPAEKPAEIKVNPGDPVITMKGVCDDPAKQGDACQTVVTREQFEKLAEALQPNMPAPIRVRLANAYSRLLVMGKEAEKRGLDKSPKFEELIHFARMQILSQQLNNTLQQDSAKVSDSDIEEYYKKKQADYEEANLLRIFVPLTKQVAPPKPATPAKATAPPKATAASKNAPEKDSQAQAKAAEEAMKKAAIALQARAAKGEDFDKLQKEAYVLAGIKGTPPSTKMEKIRPVALQAAHKVALELKPGAVTDVISDANGHYIYKMVSKDLPPLDKVKADIKNQISSERYRDAMQKFQEGNVNLNEAYFGPLPKPRTPAQPGKPPAQEGTEPD